MHFQLWIIFLLAREKDRDRKRESLWLGTPFIRPSVMCRIAGQNYRIKMNMFPITLKPFVTANDLGIVEFETNINAQLLFGQRLPKVTVYVNI